MKQAKATQNVLKYIIQIQDFNLVFALHMGHTCSILTSCTKQRINLVCEGGSKLMLNNLIRY